MPPAARHPRHQPRQHPRRHHGALLALLLCIPVGLAAAPQGSTNETAQDKAQRLEQLRERIQQLDTDLEDKRDRQSSIREELRQIETRLSHVHRNLRLSQQALKKARQQLTTLRQQRQQTRRYLDQNREVVSQMLRLAWAQGRQPRIKLILNQEDPSSLSRALAYHRYIHKERIQRIKTVYAKLQRLQQLEIDIAAQTRELSKLSQARQRKQATLKQGKRVRNAVLARLKQQIATGSQQLGQLQKDQKQLQKLVQGLQTALADIPPEAGQRQAIRKQRGKLQWPTKGRIVASYGSRRSRDLRWHGVMIATEAGAEVKAISHGRVAYSDWLRGLGLLVIIDHGDGIMSLYGHNEALYVEVGDWVETGDVIATVGNSGGLNRAALYFEIRQAGKPDNPKRWCRRTRGHRIG